MLLQKADIYLVDVVPVSAIYVLVNTDVKVCHLPYSLYFFLEYVVDPRRVRCSILKPRNTNSKAEDALAKTLKVRKSIRAARSASVCTVRPARVWLLTEWETWHQRAIITELLECLIDIDLVLSTHATYPPRRPLLPAHSHYLHISAPAPPSPDPHARHDIADPRTPLSPSLCLGHPPTPSLRRGHAISLPLPEEVYRELRVPLAESPPEPVALPEQWRVGP